MAGHLAAKEPKPRVAIIYVNNEVGNFSKDRFIELYEKLDGEIVASEAYMPDVMDFRAQLTKLGKSQPDVLYFLSYGEWGAIAKQARELGMNSQFVGATPTEDRKALAIAGSAGEGTIYTKAAYDPRSNDPEIERFQQNYIDRYGEVADVYGATFRDNLILVAIAAKQGHTSGKELIDAIIDIGTFHGASGPTKFLENRDVEKPVALFKIEQGTFRRLVR